MEVCTSTEVFVEESLADLAGEPTQHQHADVTRPVRTLLCCCCGSYTKGRQFHNQDTGFGLGTCCVDFVKARVPDMERTYGVEGVHYFAPKPPAPPAPMLPDKPRY